MNLQVVSIFDRAIQAFGRPAFVPAVGAALRGFGDEVNRKESEMAAHPDDYDLYHLGAFDDHNAQFTMFQEPILLVRGKDVLTKEA